MQSALELHHGTWPGAESLGMIVRRFAQRKKYGL